jgi:hypothetical protein
MKCIDYVIYRCKANFHSSTKVILDKLSTPTPQGKTETEEDKEAEFDLCIQDSFNNWGGSRKVTPKRALVSQESYPDSIETVTMVLKTLNNFKVIALFSELTNGQRISEFLVRYQQDGVNRSNIKYFVEFGLLNNLIYRMHKHVLHSSNRK